jgi:hypothetical protein
MVYIGSSMDISTRWREHKYDLRMNNHRNQHLQNAYNKYGKDAFVYEVLELIDEENKDQQFEREQYWIDLKEACNKKKGYNIQSEVLIVPKISKKVVCLETKEIFESLEEAGRAKGISSGSISCCCNKRKLKQTGGYHWMFYDEYINMTEEEIEKVLYNKWKRIVCLETGEIFKSYHETGINKCTVQNCCTQTACGNIRNCFGKHYLYKEDYDKLSEKQIKDIIDYKPEGYKGSGKVVCLETGKVYRNANQAAADMGFTGAGNILKCCYKKATISHNLHWLFEDEYKKLSSKQIKDYLSKKSIDSYVKPIICLETRKVYRTQIDAAKDTNISKDMINVMCNCGGYNRSKNSLHFVFFDDYKNMSDSDITRILSAVSKQIKKVRCIETGVVFSSVTEAAKSVGDQTTNISKCCKYPNRICKGYHWEYIEKEEVV